MVVGREAVSRPSVDRFRSWDLIMWEVTAPSPSSTEPITLPIIFLIMFPIIFPIIIPIIFLI